MSWLNRMKNEKKKNSSFFLLIIHMCLETYSLKRPITESLSMELLVISDARTDGCRTNRHRDGLIINCITVLAPKINISIVSV